MADSSINQTPPFNLTKQQQEWVNRETDLLVKLKHAQDKVAHAEDQVAQAQAQLDDSREELRTIQSQLNAMYHEPGAVRQMNTQPEQGGQQGQMGQTGQTAANQGQNAANVAGSDETYVDGAVDTELANTPGRARYDVLQNESQEIYQEHAVARDMVQAEDQGEVRVPPENAGQADQG